MNIISELSEIIHKLKTYRDVVIHVGSEINSLSGKIVRISQQQSQGQSKQPIRTPHLVHVTGYQPIRDQYFLVRSVPEYY